MLIKRNRGWEISESLATPEDVFLNRRDLAKGLAAGAILAPALVASLSRGAGAASDDDPTAELYPVERNTAYALDRQLTDEEITSTYNNFYEFGSHKRIASAAQDLVIRPWTVTIDGDVEQEMTLDIDDLIRRMNLEERLYRHRCVEAWSMTIPGRVSRCPTWSLWRGRSARPNTSSSRPSTTLIWRPASASSGIPGPMSRGSPWPRRTTSSPSW